MNDESKMKFQYSIFNIQYSSQSKSAGFTLVETLVGMTVLIIAVTGTLSIISRNVSSAAIAKESVTAFYLAQEAIEYVRGVRDNNAISPGEVYWLAGLGDCIGQKCTIDVNEGSLGDQVDGCAGGCSALYLDPDTGLYTQDTSGDNVETIFTREVELVEIASDREERIDVTVKWMQGSVERSFTLSGTIFHWR